MLISFHDSELTILFFSGDFLFFKGIDLNIIKWRLLLDYVLYNTDVVCLFTGPGSSRAVDWAFISYAPAGAPVSNHGNWLGY